jgi:Tfp pilus assembly protein PilF
MGQVDDARITLKLARDNDPNAPEPIAALAELSVQAGDVAGAVALYKDALRKSPKNDDLRLQLADLFNSQQNYVAAAAQYDIVAHDRPDDATVQNMRGTAYEEAGDLHTAAIAFQAAIAADGKNALAQNNLGVVYEKQGKIKLATAAYRKAVEIDPNLSVAKENLARVLKTN